MKIHSKTLTNTSDENKQNISELNKHIKYKQKLKKKISQFWQTYKYLKSVETEDMQLK